MAVYCARYQVVPDDCRRKVLARPPQARNMELRTDHIDKFFQVIKVPIALSINLIAAFTEINQALLGALNLHAVFRCPQAGMPEETSMDIVTKKPPLFFSGGFR